MDEAERRALREEQRRALRKLETFREWLKESVFCVASCSIIRNSPKSQKIIDEIRSYKPDTEETIRAIIYKVFGKYPFERTVWITFTDWFFLPECEKKLFVQENGSGKEREKLSEELADKEGFPQWIGYSLKSAEEAVAGIIEQIDKFIEEKEKERKDMGTRCSIIVREGKEKHILYGSSDGYPEGAGRILKRILDETKGINVIDELTTRIVQHREALYYPPPVTIFYPFEVASEIHQDIEYLYVIDLEERSIICYSTAGLIGEEMTEKKIVKLQKIRIIPEPRKEQDNGLQTEKRS